MKDAIADNDFESFIQQNEKVVVKYFANWCGTCRLFAPKYKKLSENEPYSGVKFLDINAEESPIARKMAGVSNLPFFATFKNGKLVKAVATSKPEAVEAMIQEIL
jgi:thiol-disulfide isomerase/thioredoxin